MDKLWLANNHQELDFFYTTINEDATNNILLTFDVNNIANTGDKYMEEGNYEKAKAAYESLFSPIDLIKEKLEAAPSLIFWGVLLKYQAANNLAAIAFNNNDRLQGLSELSYAIFYEIFLCLQDIAYTEDLDSFEYRHLQSLTSLEIACDVISTTKRIDTRQLFSYDAYFSILSNYLYNFAVKLPAFNFAQLFLIAITIIIRSDFSMKKEKVRYIKRLIALNELIHKKPGYSYFKNIKHRISAATMLQNTCKVLDLPKGYITAIDKIYQALS